MTPAVGCLKRGVCNGTRCGLRSRSIIDGTEQVDHEPAARGEVLFHRARKRSMLVADVEVQRRVERAEDEGESFFPSKTFLHVAAPELHAPLTPSAPRASSRSRRSSSIGAD